MMTKVDVEAIEKHINYLDQLRNSLQATLSLNEKIEILNQCSLVKDYISHYSLISEYFTTASSQQEIVIKSIIAIGQAPFVFNFSLADLFRQELNKARAPPGFWPMVPFLFGGVVEWPRRTPCNG